MFMVAMPSLYDSMPMLYKLSQPSPDLNFQILGRVAFEWFQEGPNQTFEVFAHLGYGLLVVPFLLRFAGVAEQQPAPSVARRAASATG